MKTFSQLVVGDTIWFTDRTTKPIEGYIYHIEIDNKWIDLNIIWSDGLESRLRITNPFFEKSIYHNFSTDKRESYKTHHKSISAHNKVFRKQK